MTDPFDKLGTQRQRQILEYIQACHDADELSPTVREIMDALGISSTSVVNYELDALASAGHISRERGSSRGIRLKGAATKYEKIADTLRVMQTQIADLQAEVGRLRAMIEPSKDGPSNADWQRMNREAAR